MLGRAEKRGEARTRVEAGEAEPVDRAAALDERRRLQVADQRVVLDPGHQRFPISRPSGGQRFCTARLNAASYSSAVGLVERACVAPAHVGERLGRRLDDVDVVAVDLLSLVAFGAVVLRFRVAHLFEQAARLVLGEGVELPRDHVCKPAAPEDHASSSYRSRCARALASHVSDSRARRAPARACSSAVGVGQERLDRVGERLDVAGGHDTPRVERTHGLGDAADVVGDGGHARTERAQEGAALVELRLVREHRDRRLAERAVDLGLRQVAEPPVDVDAARLRRDTARSARAGRRPRAGARRLRGAPPRSRRRDPCTAG